MLNSYIYTWVYTPESENRGLKLLLRTELQPTVTMALPFFCAYKHVYKIMENCSMYKYLKVFVHSIQLPFPDRNKMKKKIKNLWRTHVKSESCFFHCYSLLYILFSFCVRCFVHYPLERGRDREREKSGDTEGVALVGWRFRAVRRGGLTETCREEGGFALCNISTQPCLFSTPPLTPLWLPFFFSKCKSPWKMCWSNICTEVVLGQADNLSVFEFGFPCSK